MLVVRIVAWVIVIGFALIGVVVTAWVIAHLPEWSKQEPPVPGPIVGRGRADRGEVRYVDDEGNDFPVGYGSFWSAAVSERLPKPTEDEPKPTVTWLGESDAWL